MIHSHGTGDPEGSSTNRKKEDEKTVYTNLDYDMVTIISDIKEKIKKINAEEQLKMPTIKIIPMEDIILDQIGSDNTDNSNSIRNTKKSEVHQYNILLRRQQQLTQRKQHIVSPMALEGRARQLLGANSEERMVNEDMQEMLARSQADRYYKVSESENLLSDLGLESFQKPWGKLDANLKINRLMKYAEKLQVDHALDESSFKKLRIILIDAVNNRKITRKNDVQYNEELGQIMDIKGLSFDPETKTFKYNANLKKTTINASAGVGASANTNASVGASSSTKKIIDDIKKNILEPKIGQNNQVTKANTANTTDVNEMPDKESETRVEEVTSLSKEQIDLISKKKKILVTIKPKVISS